MITHINSAAANSQIIAAGGALSRTHDITVETANLQLDTDGTIPAPVFNFRIVLASDTIATAPGSVINPVTLRLTLIVQHPCRGAVFTTQEIPPLTSTVDYGPDTVTVSPFAHNLDSSAYDCGLQSLTINEDSAFAYPYSAFMSVSTQTVNTDSYLITASTTDYAHVNVHTPYAVVQLISWPDVTLNTATFRVEIKALQLESTGWYAN